VNVEALELIDTDAAARRIIAAWPVAGAAVDADEEGEVVVTAELVQNVERLALVDREDVEARLPMLLAHGMIGAAGHVDTMARGFLQQRAVERLPASLRERLRRQAEAQRQAGGDGA
jgi:hypothetical protein